MNCSRDFVSWSSGARGNPKMLTSLARSCRMLMFVCSREEDEAEFIKFVLFHFRNKKEKQNVSLVVSMPRRGARNQNVCRHFGDHCMCVYQQNWGGASLFALLTVVCVKGSRFLEIFTRLSKPATVAVQQSYD